MKSDNDLVLLIAQEVMGWKPRGERTFDACLSDGGCIDTTLIGTRAVKVYYDPADQTLLNEIGVVNDWNPFVDARHDYDVLVKVRTDWLLSRRQAFYRLDGLWRSRVKLANGVEAWPNRAGRYEPGDYAWAAAAMIRAKGVAQRFIENPQILDDLAKSLAEEPEEWE